MTCFSAPVVFTLVMFLLHLGMAELLNPDVESAVHHLQLSSFQLQQQRLALIREFVLIIHKRYLICISLFGQNLQESMGSLFHYVTSKLRKQTNICWKCGKLYFLEWILEKQLCLKNIRDLKPTLFLPLQKLQTSDSHHF